MSVTIGVEQKVSDVAGYGRRCPCGDTSTGVLIRDYNEAQTLFSNRGGGLDCAVEYCDDDVTFPYAILKRELHEINMSNVNTRRVMELLGFTGDDIYAGETTGDDFLGRVMVAVALTPDDAGTPATEDRLPGGGAFIECGRHEGYLQERLAQLHQIGEQAAELGRRVTWA